MISSRSFCPYCRGAGTYHPREMEFSGYWAYECGNEWLDEADESAGSASLEICIIAREAAELRRAYEALRAAVASSGDLALLDELARQDHAFGHLFGARA